MEGTEVMDAHENVKTLVGILKSLEREGFADEAGRIGELAHALVGWVEDGGFVPGNLDELWLETEAVA